MKPPAETQGSVVESRPLSDKASLSGIRRSIRGDLNRAGVDPAQSFDCLVAVTEAATNALIHGGTGIDREPPAEIGWQIDPDVAIFLVRDFSTQQWSKSTHPSHEAAGLDHRVGGFGIDLMRGLMDDVAIDIGPSGTTVTLEKRFT